MHETVEELRNRMIKLAEEKGCLSDPEVLSISRRLDSLIVAEQKRRLKLKAKSMRNVYSIWQSSMTRFKYFAIRHAIFK